MIKRGQITVFIILGAVILFIVGGALFFLQYSSKSKLETQKEQAEALEGEATAVKLFVEDCLKKTLQEAIPYVAEYGGYYHLPELSSQKAYKNAPFYYYEGKKLIPLKKEVEDSLSKYVVNNLSFCLKDFSPFFFPVKQGKLHAETILGKGIISLKLSLPLEVTLSSKTVGLDSFQVSLPSRLSVLYQTSEEITELVSKYYGGICLDCVNTLAEKNSLGIQLIEVNEKETFFILFDEKNKKEGSLMYRFAVKT